MAVALRLGISAAYVYTIVSALKVKSSYVQSTGHPARNGNGMDAEDISGTNISRSENSLAD